MISHTEYDEGEHSFAAIIPLVMGTKLETLLCGVSREQATAVWDRFCARARELSGSLDRFRPSSEVSRYNRGEISSPSGDLLSLMQEADRWKELSGGLFNASYSGTLDFGGIAKGYLLEEFRTILTSSDITTAYVNFGTSSIFVLGSHPSGGPWRIDLPSPADGTLSDRFSLRDCALSVSGNTPSYNGHIIDPRSSRPVLGSRMTSVQGPSPLAAEVLSTVAMIASGGDLASLRERFPEYIISVYGQ